VNEIVAFLYSFKSNQVILYSLVFFVSFFESFAFVGEFVPGAIFSIGSGYLASKGILNVYITIIFASLGAIFADIVSFYIALLFYEDIKKKSFFRKYDSIIQKGNDFFKKHGGKSVFLGRFIGALRPIVPFVAGVFQMDRGAFLFWAVTSGILWGVSYVGLGYFFGSKWQLIERVLREAHLVVLAILAIFVMVYFIRRKKRSA